MKTQGSSRDEHPSVAIAKGRHIYDEFTVNLAGGKNMTLGGTITWKYVH